MKKLTKISLLAMFCFIIAACSNNRDKKQPHIVGIKKENCIDFNHAYKFIQDNGSVEYKDGEKASVLMAVANDNSDSIKLVCGIYTTGNLKYIAAKNSGYSFMLTADSIVYVEKKPTQKDVKRVTNLLKAITLITK